MKPDDISQNTFQQQPQAFPSNVITGSPQPAMPPQPSHGPRKKLFIIGGAIITLLLVAIAALVVILVGKSDDKATPTATNTTQSTPSTANNQASATPTTPAKQVLLTTKTSNEKLEFQIFKPTQNAANTTINFGVKNICSGCSDTTFSGNVAVGYNNNVTSYLVDDTLGKKYSVISDEDGKVLASSSCGSYIKYNDTTECFVAFSKVPSGTTVSWVFGSTRIDGIKVE